MGFYCISYYKIMQSQLSHCFDLNIPQLLHVYKLKTDSRMRVRNKIKLVKTILIWCLTGTAFSALISQNEVSSF